MKQAFLILVSLFIMSACVDNKDSKTLPSTNTENPKKENDKSAEVKELMNNNPLLNYELCKDIIAGRSMKKTMPYKGVISQVISRNSLILKTDPLGKLYYVQNIDTSNYADNDSVSFLGYREGNHSYTDTLGAVRTLHKINVYSKRDELKLDRYLLAYSLITEKGVKQSREQVEAFTATLMKATNGEVINKETISKMCNSLLKEHENSTDTSLITTQFTLYATLNYFESLIPRDKKLTNKLEQIKEFMMQNKRDKEHKEIIKKVAQLMYLEDKERIYRSNQTK